VRACPRVAIPEQARGHALAHLRRWLDRPHVLHTAAFVLLYRVGDRAMGPMIRPLWVDLGYSNTEIGLVTNTLGQIATAAGAIAGAACVVRLGIGRSLWILGAVALASNLAYAGAAAFPASGWQGLYAASLVESFTGGLAGVGFMSYLMRLCEKEHAAVQYAVLTGVYAFAGTLVATPSGWLTEQMGYATYFALTAALALPAFAFLPRARRLLDGTS
jgi:PAT family beta-lactamase induction signal transducer AmpG